MNRLVVLVTFLLGPVLVAPAALAQTGFTVRIDEKVFPGDSFTGRIYVALSTRGEPRKAMHAWVQPPPVFARDVEAFAPGDTVDFEHEDPALLFHPASLADIPTGTYSVQAIARVNLDLPKAGLGPGDLMSEPITLTWPDAADDVAELVIDQVVEPSPFPESESVKLFEFRSPALSKFHGRDVTMRAGVVLPKSWNADATRRYPVVYDITGFGGSHLSAIRKQPLDDVLLVVPDARCYWGHSVFCDSETNGPWGEALVYEMIPALEEAFHGAGAAHRYTTGISSGGWASLWLQVAYPDEFRACFSHVPDPVDFRDFQQMNLYEEGTNFFFESDETKRPVARRGNQVMLYYRPFVEREVVLGPGGQIMSFEGCFSPRGPDGQPVPVFDRKTGEAFVDVAKKWEKYDINLVLKNGWSELGPKLSGKLHVWGGEIDTFYLEGAVALLKETLAELKSDAEIEVIPGMAHSLHRPGQAHMLETIRENWALSQADG